MTEMGLATVEQAVQDHIYNTQMARGFARAGTNFPPFKAFFKINTFRVDVVKLFQDASSFPIVGDLGRCKFICIRTELEALQYEVEEPALWFLCRRSPVVFYINGEGRIDAVYLCPMWFEYSNDVRQPQPSTCPVVRNNVFARNPRGSEFVITKATFITYVALNIYGRVDNSPDASSISQYQYLNFCMGFSSSVARKKTWSYLFFTFCKHMTF